jgi:hypothetical protein
MSMATVTSISNPSISMGAAPTLEPAPVAEALSVEAVSASGSGEDEPYWGDRVGFQIWLACAGFMIVARAFDLFFKLVSN